MFPLDPKVRLKKKSKRFQMSNDTRLHLNPEDVSWKCWLFPSVILILKSFPVPFFQNRIFVAVTIVVTRCCQPVIVGKQAAKCFSSEGCTLIELRSRAEWVTRLGLRNVKRCVDVHQIAASWPNSVWTQTFAEMGETRYWCESARHALSRTGASLDDTQCCSSCRLGNVIIGPLHRFSTRGRLSSSLLSVGSCHDGGLHSNRLFEERLHSILRQAVRQWFRWPPASCVASRIRIINKSSW